MKNNRNSINLIRFDVDGTLVDSQHHIVLAVQKAFATNGLPAPARRAILSGIGLSIPEYLRKIYPEGTPEIWQGLGEAYKEQFQHIRQTEPLEALYPGAEKLVRLLAGKPENLLGLATGKSRRGVDYIFEKYDLLGCFSTIKTADNYPSKPNPAMLLEAMAECGVEAKNTVMIGDTSYDMLMANSAGCLAVGVSWGYHEADDLTNAGAQIVAQDMVDLQQILGSYL